jgi:hypothetical protein
LKHTSSVVVVLLAIVVEACAGLLPAVLPAALLAPVVPVGHVWLEEPRCSMSSADVDACRGQGTPGRPLVCSGVELPEHTDEERRTEEERYRTGTALCVCSTPAMQTACSMVHEPTARQGRPPASVDQ